MQLKLKSKVQSEHDAVSDRVSAALETGNVQQARTLMVEYRDKFPEHASKLRASVIAEYGITL